MTEPSETNDLLLDGSLKLLIEIQDVTSLIPQDDVYQFAYRLYQSTLQISENMSEGCHSENENDKLRHLIKAYYAFAACRDNLILIDHIYGQKSKELIDRINSICDMIRAQYPDFYFFHGRD